jgi:hypothetical protein
LKNQGFSRRQKGVLPISFIVDFLLECDILNLGFYTICRPLCPLQKNRPLCPLCLQSRISKRMPPRWGFYMFKAMG